MSGIQSLRLRNFRRYDDVTFAFGPGITFLEGVNNAGKSTVFYAIEYALFGKVGTTLGPDGLMRPRARGLGVELCFVGRDGLHYRLQRVHIRPPRSRSKVVGHFTLWQRDDEPEAPERYVLSSDFDDLETDLAAVLYRALGVSRRAWDLAVHLRQGTIADILVGAPTLDMVLGVTASVFVEEELRAMALEREKAAAELPALEADLGHLDADREGQVARRDALSAEATSLEEAHAAAQAAAAAVQSSLAALEPLRDVAGALETLERAREQAESLGEPGALALAVDEARRAVEAARAEASDRREAVEAGRAEQRALDGARGDLAGRIARRQALDGAAVCDQCGQPIDPGHLAAELPLLTAELAALDDRLARAASAIAAGQAEVDAAEEVVSDARLHLAGAERALASRQEAEARVHEAAAAAAGATESAAELRARYHAERDVLRTQQVRLEADQEHGAERLRQLTEETASLSASLEHAERRRAEVEGRVLRLRQELAEARRLRTLSKAFKGLQQDLREQATTRLAERTLAIHRHLSGDDRELKDITVDPKRYAMLVTPRDVGRQVPAALAQGGGHRLLLGLAARLALAEQLGPVPFILLDEPTYGLDARNRSSLLDRIASLGVADQLILITHHEVGAERGTVLRVQRDGARSVVQETP